ncbi:hypothetical protein LBE40_08290 [Bartonella taylorii]|uniref:Conjugal transfer protein TrbH n=1 Tax=Bartonella taylorii 8TBB TaxID=1094560 RepID=A0A9P2S0Y6_BARTA|nr:hypothetical protein [Bartonella taylorii]EJF97733.1 hypothetical protein ME9_00112 [Bartonella taylorii 8TBB]USP01256.1 hypothetical protein LBE40_08290 [Bartonella taylorii]
MLKYLLLPPLVLAAGCASVNDRLPNYVDQNVTKNTAKLIADDFVRNLKKPLPPATTTLIIKKNNTEDNFTPLFVSLLRRNGYSVIYTDQPQKQQNMGVTLTYRITPMDKGIMSVVYYEVAGVTRYYIRTYNR